MLGPFPTLLVYPPRGFLGYRPIFEYTWILVLGPTSRTIQAKTCTWPLLSWPSFYEGRKRTLCFLPGILINLLSSLNPAWQSLTRHHDFQAGFINDGGRSGGWTHNYLLKIIRLVYDYPKCFAAGTDSVGYWRVQQIWMSLQGKLWCSWNKNTVGLIMILLPW